MAKTFKDFLYLDNDIVSDLYGQIFQEEIIGKILSAGNASTEQKADTTGRTQSDTTDVQGGGNIGVASASILNSNSVSTSSEEQILSTEELNTNESVTMALNNFKYTKVIENLQNSDLLNSDFSKQHEFIRTKDTFE